MREICTVDSEGTPTRTERHFSPPAESTSSAESGRDAPGDRSYTFKGLVGSAATSLQAMVLALTGA
jgi:hypothetical protein